MRTQKLIIALFIIYMLNLAGAILFNLKFMPVSDIFFISFLAVWLSECKE